MLITGAGGFIGRRLVAGFLNAGFSVVAADRAPGLLAEAAARGAEVATFDLLDAPAAVAAMRRADVVVNNAGVFDFAAPAARMARVNHEGATRMAQAARRAGVRRFVQVSTVGVYGRPAGVPCREASRKQPRTAYERTKWAGEQAAFSTGEGGGMEVTAIRPTLVYGPGSAYGLAPFLALFSLLSRDGRRRLLLPPGGPLTHYVHVDDVVGAALAAATHPAAPGRAFNVADLTPLPLGDAVALLAGAVGLALALPRVAARLLPMAAALGLVLPVAPVLRTLNQCMARRWSEWRRAAESSTPLSPRLDGDWLHYARADHAYDTAALRETLGYMPAHPSFARALPEVVAWYASAGWLPVPARGARG